MVTDNEWTDYVLSRDQPRGAERLALALYSMYSDRQGDSYPGADVIAEGLGVRTVMARRLIAKIEAAGWIERHGFGPRGAIIYRLTDKDTAGMAYPGKATASPAPQTLALGSRPATLMDRVRSGVAAYPGLKTGDKVPDDYPQPNADNYLPGDDYTNPEDPEDLPLE